MHHGKMSVVFALIIALSGVGCNDDSPASGGPIDGTYTISGLTCNGTSTSFLGAGQASMSLVIANATGSFITVYTSGCVATEGTTYTYPSSTTISQTTVNRVCSSGCSGSECTPNSNITDPASTETYSLSGSTLTLSHTSTGTTDNCTNGQAVVYTLTKQ